MFPPSTPLGMALWGQTYRPPGILFDGTNDFLARGADLTGNVDGNFGSIAFWLDPRGGDGVIQRIVHNAANEFSIARLSTNKLQFFMSSTSTPSLTFETVSSLVAADGWTHIAASWDTAQSAGNKISQIYRNGVSDRGTPTDASASFNIDYTATDWLIGGKATATVGADKLNAAVTELLFLPGVFIDWSNPAMLALVYRNGKPVDPGTNGSRLGSIPRVYLTARYGLAGAGINQGDGGGFTVTGALDIVPGPP